MKGTNARIYRRHRPKCKFFGIQDSLKELSCNCPLYGDGYVGGKRVLRQSLSTRNQVVAWKKLGELMAKYTNPANPREPVPERKSVAAAVEAFIDYHGVIEDGLYRKLLVEYSTYRKYRSSARRLAAFCKSNGFSISRTLVLNSWMPSGRVEQLDQKPAATSSKPSGNFGPSA